MSATKEQLWRVAIGMSQREVWAEGPFDAAHKCGLGSGDLEMATIEVLQGDDAWPTGFRGEFRTHVAELPPDEAGEGT